MSTRNIEGPTKQFVAAMMDIAKSLPTYPYPWDSLESNMEQTGETTLRLMGYGSLINAASASQTLTVQQVERRNPVIAFGLRRLFNYPIPRENRRYRLSRTNEVEMALNVLLTGNIDDMVNGVLIEVDLPELPELRLRELNYDLVPIVCIAWDSPDESPLIAYTLHCPDDPFNERTTGGDYLIPNVDYYEICRRGAEEFGDEFLELWLQSTYLADACTPVSQWESQVKSGN